MKKVCFIRKGDVVRKATLSDWGDGKLMAFIHQTPEEVEARKIPPPVMFTVDGEGENGWEIDF